MSANPLTIENFIDVDNFTVEINSSIDDLQEEFRTITARTAFYAVQAAKAKTQSARIDNIVKATEAKLKMEHRRLLVEEAQKIADAEGSKPERITADMVSAAVHTDPRMIKLLNIQMDADEIKTVCTVAVDAFRTRREAAKSLGILTTEQMRSNLRLNHQQGSSSTEAYRQRRAARENSQGE